jgi:hypothetical protein
MGVIFAFSASFAADGDDLFFFVGGVAADGDDLVFFAGGGAALRVDCRLGRSTRRSHGEDIVWEQQEEKKIGKKLQKKV